ncbi:MAG: type IV secretory system conjugative DNA transfer family protein [Microcystis aeruginosa Ma_QC_Ch_20071001_M135]|nr:MAG: type IV secretory system conjugative DNA transfer family protein [Microcystis aeruginosa Ma_QC_Ch_20071001_M135]
MAFIGILVMFGVTVAMFLGLARWRYPAAKAQSRKIIESQRRLTDNDERLFEIDGMWRALFWALPVGLIPLSLYCVTAFHKLGDGVSMIFFLGIPSAGLLVLGLVLFGYKNYGDTLQAENARKRALKGRYGEDVQKAQTVDTTRGEVLDKLAATNKAGPLVLLQQLDTHASKEAERKRRDLEPWRHQGWRASTEDRAVVIGAPGAGKTTFLIAQLVDWMTTGRSFVATDIKPEIWSILKENGLFERFGYTDYVVNPTCQHAHKFNLFAEVEDDADMNEILAVIIPLGEGDSAVFADNARRLLKAVLLELPAPSLPAARDFMSNAGKTSDLLEILANSDKKTVKRIAQDMRNSAGNDRLMSSILTAMTRAFEFMDDERIEAAISSSDFSMRDVLMRPRSAVFLQYEQNYKSSLSTLFGGTVAYTLRLLQATASQREHAVFVALDEIMNAAPIPKFSESLNTMRSAKMPLAMYLQSVEGLNKLYGPNSDQLFLGSADLKVVFRVNDNTTSEYMSAQIGDTEQRSLNATESVQSSQSGGRGGISDSISRSHSSGYSSSTARIIDPAELLQLEPGKAIVFYRGSGAKFSMPRYDEDYPATLKAAVDPRPQVRVVRVDAVAA